MRVIFSAKKHELDFPLLTHRKMHGQNSLSERMQLKQHQAQVDFD